MACSTHEGPAARAGAPYLRTARAGDWRCRRAGQADDRRRDLLRLADWSDRRRGAVVGAVGVVGRGVDVADLRTALAGAARSGDSRWPGVPQRGEPAERPRDRRADRARARGRHPAAAAADRGLQLASNRGALAPSPRLVPPRRRQFDVELTGPASLAHLAPCTATTRR